MTKFNWFLKLDNLHIVYALGASERDILKSLSQVPSIKRIKASDPLFPKTLILGTYKLVPFNVSQRKQPKVKCYKTSAALLGSL